MKATGIMVTVLACLALGLLAGAATAVAARIIGIEPLPPGVLGAAIGVMTAAMIVQRRRA